MRGSFERLRARCAHGMDACERLLTELGDSDEQWWPFVFLRPQPETFLSNRRVALLSVLYGVPAGLLAVILAALLGSVPDEARLGVFLAASCIAFFVAYRSTFAFFWNRRAARFRRQRSPRVIASPDPSRPLS